MPIRDSSKNFIDLPGLRMHYVAAGPPEAETVVLLHGFPESSYAWRHQIDPLVAAGYRVVVPDQRGYSLTGQTPPYDLATLVGDIVGLLDALGCDRVHLAGHDWGAMVAWTLAAWHPQRVARLLVLNVPHPSVLLGVARHLDVRQLLRSWYSAFFQVPVIPELLLRARDFALLRWLLLRTARPGSITRDDLARYREAWSRPGALSAMLGWYRALPHLVFNPTERRRLDLRIAAPTLLCWGMRDFVLRPALADASMAWVDTGEVFRFRDGSHWLPEEFPAEVAALMVQHFGRTARGAS